MLQSSISPTIDVTSNPVTLIQGITGNITTVNFFIGAGISTSIESLSITNQSNQAVTLNSSYSSFVSLNAKAGNLAEWIAYASPNVASNIAADNNQNFDYQIKSAFNAAHQGATQTTINLAIQNASAVQNYIGFNQISYGGAANFEAGLTTIIVGPEITIISRTTTFNVPENFIGNTDLVPGSKISYTFVIQNTGAAIANTINITDVIPNNTTFYEIPNGGSEDSIEYKILGSYGSFSPPSSNVDALRFIKTQLNINEIATFNYTVTVN